MIPNTVSSLPTISRENWGNVVLAFTLLFLAAKIWDLTRSIRELEASMVELWDETSTASNATDEATDEDATDEDMDEDDTIMSPQNVRSESMDDPFIENVSMQSRLKALNREVAMRATMDLRKRAAMRRAVRILKVAGRERG